MSEELENLSPVELRRREVEQYDANIALYKELYENLPHEWPERLAHLRGERDEHSAAAKVEDLEDVALLGLLFQSDKVYAAIRSETVERAKAASILSVLEQQG